MSKLASALTNNFATPHLLFQVLSPRLQNHLSVRASKSVQRKMKNWLTLIDLGRFLRIFEKSDKKFSIINISTTTHTREMNYSAFERPGTGISFWSGPVAARPIFQNFSFFFRYRGLVVRTAHHLVLLHKVLSWKGYLAAFLHGPRTLKGRLL